MQENINHILTLQRSAWRNGHDNYGASIDVQAATLYFLKYFKHLNPAQKALEEELSQLDELKFAKQLCSRAHKAVRHFVVTLK